jgi:epidermal growth factor receptor substrate 15
MVCQPTFDHSSPRASHPVRNLVDTTNRGSLDAAQFVLAMYLIQGSMSANPTIPVLPPSLPAFLWEQAGGRPPSVNSHTTGESLPSPKLAGSGMAGVGVPRAFTPQYTGGSGTSHQPSSTFTGLTSQTTGSRLPRTFPASPQLTGSPFPLARAPAQPAPLPWDITAEEKAKTDGFFDSLDTGRVGYVEGGSAGAFMLLSGLSEEVLAKVWCVTTF